MIATAGAVVDVEVLGGTSLGQASEESFGKASGQPELPREDTAAPRERGAFAEIVQRRRRKGWTPSETDHLVYQWVKFDGQTQAWVAGELGLSQGTVSRTIERYERWQAHLQPGAGGALDPAERLRAQLWLTYARNERILASALRIAGEMEGFVDVSKSVSRRPADKPSQETEIRTECGRLDRSGVAARFLRLAFRINMEQLKLAEREPLPPLPPIVEEEIGDGEADEQSTGSEGDASRSSRSKPGG